MSGAFAELRKLLPSHPADKKLSKSEILKLSIRWVQLRCGEMIMLTEIFLFRYIKLLEGVLEWQEEEERKKIIT